MALDPRQIEMEIDNKVFEWAKSQQTKFKPFETEKIIQFNLKVIEFLENLKPNGFPDPIFMMLHEIISLKIRHLRHTIINLQESL